ncbi:MAG: extracellular solute-binding protein [Clostridia bacterium]|nr:extracellular solute-binding protein [Clostridia bacterium]
MKRYTALILAIMMILPSLTSCTKKDKDGQGDAKKVTLTVWAPSEDQPDEEGWLPVMCETFNDAHPEWDITFKYGVCSEGDAGKNVSADPSGSADVYFFANDQLGSLLQANAISRLGGTVLDEIKKSNSDAMVASVTSPDGGVYGVPFSGNTWFMFYNKSIFSEEDVKSLDTMLKKGKVAFPLTNSWYAGAFYLANGCTLFGENGTDSAAGINFGGKAGTEATQYLCALAADPNFVNDAEGAGLSGLLGGSIGAIFSGSWDAEKIKSALGDDFGAAPLPTALIGGVERQLLSFSGSKAIGVNPNCSAPEVAVALASFLGSREAQEAHYDMRGIIPSHRELLQSEKLRDDITAQAQDSTISKTAVVQPSIPEMAAFWVPMENMGKAIVNGEVTERNAREKTEAFNASLRQSL